MPQVGEIKKTQSFWLSWVLLALLLLGIVLVVVNINQRQIFGPSAGAPGVFDGSVTLSADRTVNNLQVGNEFTVAVNVRSVAHDIYGTDLIFNYNSSVLEVISIQLGAAVRNGCTTGSGSPAAVLAPITSETNCAFSSASVISGGNSQGQLKFGVVAFDWNQSSQQNYTPAPLPRNVQHHVANVRFRAKANGSSPVSVKFDGQNVTTDSNIGTIFTDNTVGDVLATITGNLSTQVGGGQITCTRFSQGNIICDSATDSIIDVDDFSAWLLASRCVDPTFRQNNQALCNTIDYNADVTGDGRIDALDFARIVNNLN